MYNVLFYLFDFMLLFYVFSLVRFSKQTVQWLQMLEAFNKALKVGIVLNHFRRRSKVQLPIIT